MKNNGKKRGEVGFAGAGNLVNKKLALSVGGTIAGLKKTNFQVELIGSGPNGSKSLIPVNKLGKRGSTKTFAGGQKINGFDNVGFTTTIGA